MTTTVLTPADVLREAADWLNEDHDRWGPRWFRNPVNNCRCALGALGYVLAPLDLEGNPTALHDPEKNELGMYTADFLASYLVDIYGALTASSGISPVEDVIETVADWNDEDGRTAQDVISAMRSAADEFDARQAARMAARQARMERAS